MEEVSHFSYLENYIGNDENFHKIIKLDNIQIICRTIISILRNQVRRETKLQL